MPPKIPNAAAHPVQVTRVSRSDASAPWQMGQTQTDSMRIYVYCVLQPREPAVRLRRAHAASALVPAGREVERSVVAAPARRRYQGRC
jgi:hypothetical protein